MLTTILGSFISEYYNKDKFLVESDKMLQRNKIVNESVYKKILYSLYEGCTTQRFPIKNSGFK